MSLFLRALLLVLVCVAIVLLLDRAFNLPAPPPDAPPFLEPR